MKLFGFAISLGLLCGLLAGRLTFALLPTLPIPNTHPLFAAFGLRRPYVLGFLPYWLIERAQESYDDKLTSLAYFALTVSPDGSIQKSITAQEQEPGWTALTGNSLHRKTRLPTTLVLHNSNEDELLALIKDPIVHADRLVSQVAPILNQYNIAHLNLDFESFSQVSEDERTAFTTFIQHVVAGVKNNSGTSVSFDLVPYHLIKRRLSDPIAIARLVDYVILMGYDFSYSQSYLAGPVSPVGGAGRRWDYDVATALELATQQIPKEKILLGLALYGYEWQTLSNIPGSAVIPHTAAVASNRRVESLLAGCTRCTASFDEVAKEPSLTFPKDQLYQQIFYTNEASLGQKLQLAKQYKLGGVALWALGYEGKTMLNPLTTFKRDALWLD